MKGKILSLVLIASLLASMALIDVGAATLYTPGVDPDFKVILPNGGQYMQVDPGGEPGPCDQFNISVEIQNVAGMTAFGVTVLWNSVYVTAKCSKIWLGPAIKAEIDAGNWSGPYIEYCTNDALGGIGIPNVGALVGWAATAKGAEYALSGNFILLIVEFHVERYGVAGWYIWKDQGDGSGMKEDPYPDPSVLFTPTGWMSAAGPQAYDVVWAPGAGPPCATNALGQCANALMIVKPPPPYPPEVINKDISPDFPQVCDTVTIDWDCKPGFNGLALCPCAWCYCLLTLPSGAILAFNCTPAAGHCSVSFHANESGVWHIAITCYAPGMPSPPGGYGYDICQTFTVRPKAETGVDVYEVRGTWSTPPDPEPGPSGEGIGTPGRPFDPQSLVVLEAYVFYNNEPVQCKIVCFEVLYCGNITCGECPCEGSCILYRTDQADENGIARIEFRIPELCWDYGGPEALFGKWCVIVTTEMCEVKYNDTMMFEVGWIIRLSQPPVSCNTTLQYTPGQECAEGVGCTPAEMFKKCDYVCFNVTITNIDWVQHSVVLILVVYDDNEVPIGQCIIELNVTGGTFCNPYVTSRCICVHIPKFAYVGLGVGYINAFTDLPRECGLAWCPEVSDGFIILVSADP